MSETFNQLHLRSPSTASTLNTIPYARPGLTRRSRLSIAIGIVSIAVACISLFVSGNCEHAALQDLSSSMHDISAAKNNAAQNLAIAAAIEARPPPRGLTDAEINAVLAYTLHRAQNALGSPHNNALEPAQIKTLTLMLSAPGQFIISTQLPVGPPNYDQDILAVWQRDGDLYFRTDYSDPLFFPHILGATEFSMHVSKTGDVSQLSIESPGKTTVIAPNGATASYPGYLWLWKTEDPVPLQVRNKFTGRILVFAVYTINLALAILLFAAAISLLMRHRSGIWLHRVYALAKPPASFAGGLAFIWSVSDSPLGMFAPYLIIPSLVGWIYPAILLALLRGKAVSDYQSEAVTKWPRKVC
jgi:hypothetical protein